MTKVLGPCIALMCLLLGLAGTARAQTLQADAIALTTGDYLTLDGLEISITSVACNDGGGSGRNGSPPPVACSNLFLAPVSGTDPEVIIEAANGDTPGVSTLTPIFSYSCPATGSCTTGVTYDLTVTLDVQSLTGEQLYDVGQVLTGSETGPDVGGTGLTGVLATDFPGDVHLGEAVTGSAGSQVCSETLNVSNLTAACPTFAGQSSLGISKDLGLSLNGVTNGSALTLWSVAQVFTPEPASLATFAVGLLALGATRRRRRG